MTPERWQKIREVLDAAMQLDRRDRTAYLDRVASNDSGLRREVESLLASHENAATGFLLSTEPSRAAGLAAGTNIGPYKIVCSIGAGGMGEVYRAHDPRLQRDVAIKVLRQIHTSDADRLRRFEQEARAAAALNHPNILAIHDFGTTEQSVPYVVSELLEGENLRQRLHRGAVPLRKTVDYALQMLRGLAAAHDKGIVHRDLKPENLFLTKDGLLKILDLGLAKLMRREKPPENPTVATADGIVMGTVGYMSPEQALGEEVDHRTDIFAVGTILHEMLSGARAFQGETPAAVMKAVISDDPRDLSSDGRVPIALERVIQRCLEKNPADRFQSARDVAFALEAISSGGIDERHLAPLQATKRRHLGIALVLAMAFGLVLSAAIYFLRVRRDQPVALSPADLQIVQLTSTGNAERPSISPDGKYVVYVQHEGDAYSLRIHQVTTGSDVEIVGAQPGGTIWGARVTPDGAFVDFLRLGLARIMRVPFIGGAPKEIVDSSRDLVMSLPGWSPDGRHMAFIRDNSAQATSKLVIAESNGTNDRTLAARQGEAGFESLMLGYRPNVPPAWSPDGRLIAVAGYRGNGLHIAVFNTDTAEERDIPVQGGLVIGLEWLSADALVMNNALETGGTNQLFLLSYPDGHISRLSNDPNTYTGVSVAADRASLVTARSETRVGIWVGDSAANQGTEIIPPVLYPYPNGLYQMFSWGGERLIYAAARGTTLSISRMLPGKERPEEILAEAATPATTWDGQRVVFTRPKDDGLWKSEAEGSHPIHLVEGRANGPIVTGDGKVVFVSDRLGIESPWIVPLDGGSPTEIAHVFAALSSIDVSPDSRSIVFRARTKENQAVTMICDLPACKTPRILPALGEPSPLRWTPDGKGIAYVPTATPSNAWIHPLDGGKEYQLTHFPDRMIVDLAWSHDGKHLAIARSSTTNDIVMFKGLKK